MAKSVGEKRVITRRWVGMEDQAAIDLAARFRTPGAPVKSWKTARGPCALRLQTGCLYFVAEGGRADAALLAAVRLIPGARGIRRKAGGPWRSAKYC